MNGPYNKRRLGRLAALVFAVAAVFGLTPTSTQRPPVPSPGQGNYYHVTKQSKQPKLSLKELTALWDLANSAAHALLQRMMDVFIDEGVKLAVLGLLGFLKKAFSDDPEVSKDLNKADRTIILVPIDYTEANQTAKKIKDAILKRGKYDRDFVNELAKWVAEIEAAEKKAREAKKSDGTK